MQIIVIITFDTHLKTALTWTYPFNHNNVLLNCFLNCIKDIKTLEELDEVDSVEMGSGYLMCLVEVNVQDSKTSSDKKIFGLVVSEYC